MKLHTSLIEYFQQKGWTEKPAGFTWQQVYDELLYDFGVTDYSGPDHVRKSAKKIQKHLQSDMPSEKREVSVQEAEDFTFGSTQEIKPTFRTKKRWMAQTPNGIEWLESEEATYPDFTKQDIVDVVKDLLNTSYVVSTTHSAKSNPVVSEVLNLSDIHVGMSSDDSLFGLKWNKDELMKRIETLVSALDFSADEIIINFLGDTTDGYNGQTTRKHHNLPQNLDNKGQLKTAAEFMFSLLDEITLRFDRQVKVNFLSNENHGGFISYAAGLILKETSWYRYTDQVQFNLIEDFVTKVKIQNRDFILTHGYDDTHMTKGLPKFLQPQQVTFIERILEYHKCLSKDTVVLRGDQHTYHDIGYPRFRDIMVPTFATPSQWVSMNFSSDYVGGFVKLRIENNHIQTHLIEF